MSESQTPRTDAEIASQDPYWFGRVKGEFSRQLELRCALWKRAAKAQCQDAKKATRQRQATEDYLTERYRKDQSRIKELARELNEAKAKLKIATEALNRITLMVTWSPVTGLYELTAQGEIATEALNQIKQ